MFFLALEYKIQAIGVTRLQIFVYFFTDLRATNKQNKQQTNSILNSSRKLGSKALFSL